jgi:8-oxo-dGTP diphosphatase
VSGRPKVVQFWRMQAIGGPVRALMRDVKAMQWLPLEDAIAQLTHVRERVFLEHVGPIAVRSAELSARKSMSGARAVRKSTIGREQPAMPDAVEPAEPFLPVDLTADPAPIAGPDPLEGVDPAQASGDRGDAPCRATAPLDFADDVAPCGQSDLTAPSSPSWRADIAEPADAATARNLVEKAWTWFRHTTLPNRPMRD